MKISENKIIVEGRTKIFIVPFGDLHIGSPGFCFNTFHKFVKRIQELRRLGTVFTIGLGDYIDEDRPTTRVRRAASNADRREVLRFEDKQHKSFLCNKKEGAIQFLRRITAGTRCLGMLDGDHWREYQVDDDADDKSRTSTEFIAKHLGVPYLGEEACGVRLSFESKISHRRAEYEIIAWHGKGAASTPGGNYSIMKRFSDGFYGDLFIRGHCHKLVTAPEVVLYMDRSRPAKWKEKKKYLLNNGSFLRGYDEKKTLYPEKANYAPAYLGWGEAELTIRTSTGEFIIDTRISYT